MTVLCPPWYHLLDERFNLKIALGDGLAIPGAGLKTDGP
jgi:hypothetical protein